MTVIRAAHYDETEARLAADPIIWTMASELLASGRPISEFAHENGTPRHVFMLRANDEYRARKGTLDAHLGAVATVLLSKLRAAQAVMADQA